MADGIGPAGKRATLLSISRQAGLAASTVSRALRDDTRISDATRRLVRDLARREGYTLNASARTLSTRRSGVIGLVLGDVQNPFFPELLEALSAALTAAGQHLMLLQVGSHQLRDEDLGAILGYQMDGCIISSADLASGAADICAAHRIPMVMINRVALRHGSAVSCQNEAGGFALGQLLLDAGYRRFALIDGNPTTSTSLDRAAGFLRCLGGAGVAVERRAGGGSTYDGAYAAMTAWLRSPPLPEAVFAINDVMALGAIDAARHAGLRVPQDLGVVGFDGIRAASSPAYQLTTMSQPCGAMAERAVRLLIDRIETPSLPDEAVFIRGELKLRGSVELAGRAVRLTG